MVLSRLDDNRIILVDGTGLDGARRPFFQVDFVFTGGGCIGEVQDAVSLLGEGRLAGVVLNKYRGGVVSEGYGVDDYYAAGYSQAEPAPKSE